MVRESTAPVSYTHLYGLHKAEEQRRKEDAKWLPLTEDQHGQRQESIPCNIRIKHIACRNNKNQSTDTGQKAGNQSACIAHFVNADTCRIRSLRELSAGTVSYTHLDVYKRQDMRIAWVARCSPNPIASRTAETALLCDEHVLWAETAKPLAFSALSMISLPMRRSVSYTHLPFADVDYRQVFGNQSRLYDE